LKFQNTIGKNHTFIGNLEVKWDSNKINPAVAVLGLLVGWVAISTSGTTFKIKNSDLNFRELSSSNPKKLNKNLLQIPYGIKMVSKDKTVSLNK
jgi:hypothetical protein